MAARYATDWSQESILAQQKQKRTSPQSIKMDESEKNRLGAVGNEKPFHENS
jgi:hypothetical protein